MKKLAEDQDSRGKSSLMASKGFEATNNNFQFFNSNNENFLDYVKG